MTLDENATEGMLGYLIGQEGGQNLLQYLCEHATEHEFCSNDDDWMFRQTVLQAKVILPDTIRIVVWHIMKVILLLRRNIFKRHTEQHYKEQNS